MRDPARLDSFYNELKEIHKKYFPDYRFLQLMLDFIGFIIQDKDPFFVDDDKCLEYMKKYINDDNPLFKGYPLYDIGRENL